MGHAISWFEIPVTDLGRAKAFYEELFNFKMHELELGDGLKMALFPATEDSVGGTLIKSEEWYQPSKTKGPLIYLNANPDLQEILDKVEELGGEISIPKRLISEDHGYMAVIFDTEGNRIALHSDT
jgi:predicted enzyme related to lactoylglutathione lyase